ncbi:J domain-containing protein [Parasphingorhabdus sp.]|uniref:J domain-containing protein n=1 Tax=Parasphingorhabdus sp. TaxID=2709688 RepID=UPI003BB22436
MPSSNPQKKKPNRFHGRVESEGRICAIDGCAEDGEFRAPPIYGARHGYDGPGEYRWLCLDHVREFNQGYDFFDGMDQEQIFEAQHPVHGWDSNRRIYQTGPSDAPAWSDFTDPLDAIGARFTARVLRPQTPGRAISAGDRKALKTLGLGEDAERSDIRRRYSELVRKYHPDRNGGDRTQEKHLAEVIAAYTQLKESPDFR